MHLSSATPPPVSVHIPAVDIQVWGIHQQRVVQLLCGGFTYAPAHKDDGFQTLCIILIVSWTWSLYS